ncbi:MAG: type II secretion system protein [Kiritimatiellae bacterium]|nr:type II secretion system protein [Kiritimatiellia bacterium]
MHFRKLGFTLVELLVVIAIIGILAGALVTMTTKAGESARAMRCRVNLKNLTQAVLSTGSSGSWLVHAGSYENCWPAMYGGHYTTMYYERNGWVEWTGRPRGGQIKSTPGTTSRFYAQSRNHNDTAYVSITNNATIFDNVGKDYATYVCDTHKKVCGKNGINYVVRSYVMNAYFGYDYRTGNSVTAPFRGIKIGDLSARGGAGTLVMFAELPLYKPGNKYPHAISIRSEYDGRSPCWADSVLESKISGYTGDKANREYIGFNHLVGKRYVAHVSFADGHVEALVEPSDATEEKLKDLTEDLCNGDEIDDEIRAKMH